MNQKTAQIVFFIFNLLAVIAVYYAIEDFISVLTSLSDAKDQIDFDSGTYYLLLMSIFWVLSFIQYAGLENSESAISRYASQIVIGWFLIMLVAANVIPSYLENQLESAGYVKCADPDEVARLGRGESSVYMILNCH